MQEVYRLAQALADAILHSDIYTELKAAREAADASAACCRLERRIAEERARLQTPAARKNPDALREGLAALNRVSAELEALPEAARLRTARAGFDDLMENVNRILRMTINGDPDGVEEETPDRCAGCAGCAKSANRAKSAKSGTDEA